MKRIVITAAFVMSAAAMSAALAAQPQPDAPPSPAADRGFASGREADARDQRMAEADSDGARGAWGQRNRHHHWDDEDDDDDESESADRGGNRPADPNASNAPVPDSGIFNNHARPKVEVQ